MFAVLPLPPRGRRSFALPPKGPSPPRPSLQGRNSPSNHMKGRTVSFKERGGDGRIGVIASGGHTMTVMLRHTASWAPRYYTWLLIEMMQKGVIFSFSFLFHSCFFSFLFSFYLFIFLQHTGGHQRSCFASCRRCKGHRQQTRAAHCKEVYQPQAAPVCPSAAGAHPSTALQVALHWG